MPRKSIRPVEYGNSLYLGTGGHHASLPVPTAGLTSSITVGVWAKKSNSATGSFPAPINLWGIHTLFTSPAHTPNQMWSVNANGGAFNDTITSDTGVVTREQWVHIALSYDGAKFTLYINGVKKVHGNTFTTPLTGSGSLRINGANPFVATYQEAFASSLMTDQEVLEAYLNGTFNEDKLVGLWPLDEGAGLNVRDVSGNGNHGTVTGGVWTSDTVSEGRVPAGSTVIYNEAINPNFIGDGTIPDTWEVFSSGGTGTRSLLDGQQTLTATALNSANRRFGVFRQFLVLKKRAEAGDTIQLEMDVDLSLIAAGTGGQVYFEPKRANGSAIAFVTGPLVTSGTKATAQWTVTEPTNSVLVYFWIHAPLVWTGTSTAIFSNPLLIVLKPGQVNPGFFTGDTPDTGNYRYSWDGRPNETRSELILLNSAPNRRTIQDMKASLAFNGISSQISTNITPATTGWCFSAWLKPQTVGFPTHHYISCNTAGFTNGFVFVRSAGKSNVEVNVYNASTNIAALNQAINTAPANEWLHIVVTYLPNGTCNLYLNGTLKQTLTSTGAMGATPANTVTIGNRSYTNAFTGLVLKNFVWQNTTTSWTQEQVTALYNNNTIPTGADVAWNFDEGAGSIAYDSSGNGNDGTITAPIWTRDTPTKKRKLVGGNMVYNGDFEYAPRVNVPTTTGNKYVDGTSGGAPDASSLFGWYLWNYTNSYAAMFDTSVKRSGEASIKVSTTAVDSTCGLRVSIHAGVSFRSNNIPVIPGATYSYSGWIKTQANSGSATTGARLQFVTSTGASDVTTITAAAGLTATQDWTQYTGIFTTAPTARFITPVLQIVGNDGAGTLIMDAWFDDIEIVEVPTPARALVV